MKNKLNPYHELTELYDPFGIFGVQSILFESFKKIMFAGCDGRKKSRKRDLKEAKYSIERAIMVIEKEGLSGKVEWINADSIRILRGKYSSVVTDKLQFETGIMVLEFCNTEAIALLRDVVRFLKQMIRSHK